MNDPWNAVTAICCVIQTLIGVIMFFSQGTKCCSTEPSKNEDKSDCKECSNTTIFLLIAVLVYGPTLLAGGCMIGYCMHKQRMNASQQQLVSDNR